MPVWGVEHISAERGLKKHSLPCQMTVTTELACDVLLLQQICRVLRHAVHPSTKCGRNCYFAEGSSLEWQASGRSLRVVDLHNMAQLQRFHCPSSSDDGQERIQERNPLRSLARTWPMNAVDSVPESVPARRHLTTGSGIRSCPSSLDDGQ